MSLTRVPPAAVHIKEGICAIVLAKLKMMSRYIGVVDDYVVFASATYVHNGVSKLVCGSVSAFQVG